MENSKQCVICSYCDPENQFHERLFISQVYNKHHNAVRIGLCNNHSIELFRTGQISFMMKYYEIAKTFFDHQNKNAYNVMKEIATDKKYKRAG